MAAELKLDLTSLREAYRAGEKPVDVMAQVYDRAVAKGLNPIWISMAGRDEVLARAREIQSAGMEALPLYGIPFAVKDNFDVAGVQTTAGCPSFAYLADESATVVENLERAGAILIGKTNMDQFATGLVGTRSPYGACSSVFDPAYISGGSSSGSAVAVAKGLVSFSLGTDTAGSGRVPAAFNNVIGLKPTRGALSTAGVVPACRSLDCASIFALTAGDAQRVFETALGLDADDPYSRPFRDAPTPWLTTSFTFGVPSHLEFFGDADAAKLYENAVSALEALGGTPLEFDFAPFREAAALLYAGPWVAERLAAVGDFLSAHGDEAHPVVRGIIEGGAKYSAVDTFLAEYKLEALRKETAAVWNDVDLLLLPTTGTIYTIAGVEADPLRLNANLGYYTNFVNLLDMAAVALPAGFRPNRLPFGVTVLAPAHTDRSLLWVADRLHRALVKKLGGTQATLADTPRIPTPGAPPGCTPLAVVGAHLTGQPLNHQLTTRSARLLRPARTSEGYRLYALQNTTPPKPGLVRDPEFAGPGIEIEVWAMPTAEFGSFVAEVPAPLGIGTVETENGGTVKGFICEPSAIAGSREITEFGGWRAYLASK